MNRDIGIPEQFTLNSADRHSATWTRLAAHFAGRVSELQRKLEGNQTEAETAIIRGRIATFRELMQLGQDLPPQKR